MLAFKLLLTPVLIGTVSLVGRRWGPTVSGWLVGLPLTSGPIALFLALDQGVAFASRAAQGTLLGLTSVASFCLAYSWLSFRFNWLGSILASWCVFFASTFLLLLISLPLILAFAIVIATLAIVLKLMPSSHDQSIVTIPPQWETFLRMAVATAFVLLLTGVSSLLGPQLSGLLTPFPIFASILATFTQHFQGASAASRLLRGVITGAFTFAVFFLIIAGTIERWSIILAFGLAVLASLLTHGCSLWFLRRYIASR
jgi:hypothetical protein